MSQQRGSGVSNVRDFPFFCRPTTFLSADGPTRSPNPFPFSLSEFCFRRFVLDFLIIRFGGAFLGAALIGSVPTTPDPNTSAKVSRYKWEAYRDTNWWCIYYFLPQGGHTFAKVCHRNGRCIAILFHMYRGQGSI